MDSSSTRVSDRGKFWRENYRTQTLRAKKKKTCQVKHNEADQGTTGRQAKTKKQSASVPSPEKHNVSNIGADRPGVGGGCLSRFGLCRGSLLQGPLITVAGGWEGGQEMKSSQVGYPEKPHFRSSPRPLGSCGAVIAVGFYDTLQGSRTRFCSIVGGVRTPRQS